MRVLVTGNRGYIGSVLVEALVAEGFEVVGLDVDYYRGCDFYLCDESIKVRQIIKDVRDVVDRDLEGIDAIVHLAALSNDPMGALNPKLTRQINYHSTVRLAKLAREAGVKRFVLSSSCSVYGIAGESAIDENGILNPETEYAKSKVDSEKDIAKLADEIFSPIILRNSTVYGVSPRLRLDLVVNNLIGWAYATGKIMVMSDGSPWRPLIHVADISKAFIAALQAPRELIHNQVFNIGGNSENYQIRDIVELVRKVVPNCNIEFTGEHGADTRTYKVDFSKAANVLSDYFKPSWNVEKGVQDLYHAYQKHALAKKNYPDPLYVRIKTLRGLMETGRINNDLIWKGVR